ncbi:MAG: hypothetical protein ACFCUQ_00975 [Kiloniellales bacterium]
MTWQAVGPIVPVVLLLTVAAGVWYWLERSADLSGEELRALVVDNTIDGVWGKPEVPYRHYAAPDGAGLTTRDGAAAEADVWRIDADGAYCARLGGAEQGCYRARLQDEVYFWVDEAKSLGYPFHVLPGRQLDDAAPN